MDEVSFFEALEHQYASKLPFVVYSRPINSIIKCWLQHDDTLHTTKDFEDSGFVFAPFDLDEAAIVFPEAKCENHALEIQNLEIEDSFTNSSVSKSYGKDIHIDLVSKGIDSIKKGELEKVVLSRSENRKVTKHPLTIFKTLFNTYKNALVYCWYHPKVGLWLGATPELLFKVEGQQLTSISLAGTQPYNPEGHPNWTAKELEEQQIVTDFLVKELESYTNNTKVSEVETIRAGNLWHLKSRLVSRINSQSELKSIINILHPTPAVCGFPKAKAKAFILQHEDYNREFYTGFLGELNLKVHKSRNANRRNVENNAYNFTTTQSNFYVNLRCMQIIDNTAKIYIGGGITKDSVADNEWRETQNKAKTMGNIL
ncbi:MAG: isochorismate synthase [Winogradskyella sp.]|uniref:chorismate-binding protein n=1 Tax=Winogradskyella sp. TaxID=1883156 RepID=UPI000F3CE76C|nr:chorismate-binding protein [Winogradskyella sp.]RNC87092.1 MAG: isochorismate synthase [Winogradskyella sp.]